MHRNALFSIQIPFVTSFSARWFFYETLFHFLASVGPWRPYDLYSATCKNRSVVLQKFLHIHLSSYLFVFLSSNLLRAETEGVSRSAQQWFWVGLHLPICRTYISVLGTWFLFAGWTFCWCFSNFLGNCCTIITPDSSIIRTCASWCSSKDLPSDQGDQRELHVWQIDKWWHICI